MNRRQKIIVSVTGIFIVLLILIGLTYAYFLTRITGNGNPTSISVTTANLELVYGDGTTAILTSETPLMPSSTPIGTKDFTVTNNGDDSEYVVVFEDIIVSYAADTVINGQAVTAGTETSFESNDFVYTLTCEVKDKSGNTLTDKSCDGVEKETFPMDGGIVIGNSIDKDDVHTYLLTLYYLDNGLDQSADMNKTLNGKVNIKDIKSINPYSDNTSSLAYNIINNSMLAKNGTELVAIPKSHVAESISQYGSGEFIYERINTNDLPVGLVSWFVGDTSSAAELGSNKPNSFEEAVDKYVNDRAAGWIKYLVSYDSSTSTLTFKSEVMRDESSLSIVQDDLGTSYYYRGAVEDNYVNFAGMCWKIVRIAGDGSIKLILEDRHTTCDDNETTMTSAVYTGDWSIGTGNYGYDSSNNTISGNPLVKMSYLNPVTEATSSMVKVFYDFQTTGKLKDYTSKLKSGDWCLADTPYSTDNLSNPEYKTLISQNKNLNDLQYEQKTVFYDSYVRLIGKEEKEPTLKCTGTKIDSFKNVTYNGTKIIEEAPMYVSTLTADEIVYAGGNTNENNGNFYLLNENFKSRNAGYNYFWLLSPYEYQNNGDYGFELTYTGLLAGSGHFVSFGLNSAFRPSVSLMSSVLITGGEGTQSNPYVIE